MIIFIGIGADWINVCSSENTAWKKCRIASNTALPVSKTPPMIAAMACIATNKIGIIATIYCLLRLGTM